MVRALLVVALGVLLGGLIIWAVLSQVPSEPEQSPIDGIRRPQIQQPAR